MSSDSRSSNPPTCATCHGKGGYMGCHRVYDEYPIAFATSNPDFNPEDAARETERRWQQHLEDQK